MTCVLVLNAPQAPLLVVQPSQANLTLVAGAYQVTQEPCVNQVSLQPSSAPTVTIQATNNTLALPAAQSVITLDAAPPVITATPLVDTTGTFLANCQPSDAVGTCVAMAGMFTQGLPTVTQADPTNRLLMPCIGVIESKPTSTQAKVRRQGPLAGLSGLLEGSTYFVGANGSPALPGAFSGFVASFYIQPIGVALSATQLMVESWPITAKRMLP